MKTKLIIASIVACTTIGNAQWNGSALPTGDIGREGNVAIGPNIGTLPGPLIHQLDVEVAGTASQQDDGISIIGNNGLTPSLFLDDTPNGGGLNWRLESDHSTGSGVFKIYDFPITTASPLFLLDGNTGNCAIGSFATTTLPNKFYVETNTGNDDGIRINQIGSGAASLFLQRGLANTWSINHKPTNNFTIENPSASAYIEVDNSSGNMAVGTSPVAYRLHVLTANVAAPDGISVSQGGPGDAVLALENPSAGTVLWTLGQTGSGTSIGNPGDFYISDDATTPQLYIQNASGNVGIGGVTAPTAKLEVAANSNPQAGLFRNSSSVAGVYYGLEAIATSAGGGATEAYGVRGLANASGGQDNIGVLGETAAGTSVSNNNVGVYGRLGAGSSGGTNNSAAIYGDANSTGDFAGFFNGKVEVTGTFFVSSDRKLKSNVKPLAHSLDQLMLLKPRAYTYKTNDFPALNLPQNNQMGLIAQELEEVFPDLVTEIKEHVLPAQNGKEKLTVPSFKSVNYLGLIPVLISAMQEQQQQISAQQQKIETLENNIAATFLQKQGDATGIEQLNANNASGFYMEQNIPNPFTGETSIGFSNLPQSANKVFFTVCDLSGKQLVSIPVNERGTATLTFNASDLAAGIYLYSLIADGKLMGTNRMVVSGK